MSAHAAIVLNDFCYVQGGASKVAIDEALALHDAGVDITFIAAVGAPSEVLRDAGVRVLSLGQPELLEASRRPDAAFRSLWNRAAFALTGSVLARHDPRHTVVHLHGYTKALSTSPALAARQAGFSTVCTLHDFFAACPNGAFYDYRQQSPCIRQALSAGCMLTNCDKRHALHKAYRVMRGLAQRHYAGFPDSVRNYITLSRKSESLLRPYLPDDAALHRLDNITDLRREAPVNVAANRNLLVLGRLDAEKGVVLAAEAAHRAGLDIVFAGDGPLREALEAAGASIAGWLDSAGVWDALGRARCLVFPSRWYETFGLVVAEAAARGIPAIVSDISAAAERIENGVTGWVFCSGDIDDLARCMQMVRDDARVAEAGSSAYARFWADPPDRRRHVRELLAIYDAILARDSAAARTEDMAAS